MWVFSPWEKKDQDYRPSKNHVWQQDKASAFNISHDQ